MHGRLTRLKLSLVLLAFAVVALAIAVAILSGPTIGPTRHIGIILVNMAFDPRCWLQLGLTMAGITAAFLPKRTRALAGGLAELCVLAGLGLALAVWVPAELGFHSAFSDGPVVEPAGFPLESARIFFLGGIYIEALIHLVLGLAGSASVLAAVRLKSRT